MNSRTVPGAHTPSGPERAHDAPPDTTVERADLFSLLARGTVRIGVGDRTRSFSDIFVFLFAEQLVGLAQQTLESWERGRSYYRRQEIGGVALGVRLNASSQSSEPDSERESGLWLSVGGPRQGHVEGRTFRLADGAAFADAALGFGRALARTLLRHDPSQRQNLRLTAFRRALRLLDERLRDAKCNDVKVNPAPEAYRVFPPPPRATADGREASKLRFTPAWTATFPSIDLRGTFLCGDHLIVGGSRETACVERHSGALLWRRPTQRAVSVVTPLGLARLAADGGIALHDYGTGEVTLSARLEARVGGVVTGAVVNAPGL